MPQFDQIYKIRTALLCHYPFFGNIAFHLKLKKTEGTGEICTDGKSIFYDPVIFNGFSEDEQKGVFAHEIWHIAGMHHIRGIGKIPELWNIAADYETNYILMDSGFVLPPKGKGVPDNDKKYRGLLAEKIYDILYPEYKKNMDKFINMLCNWGIVKQIDGDGNSQISKSDIKSATQEAKMMVANAYHITKMQGNLPSGLERFIDNFLEPKVDYRVILRDLVEQTARNDYNWMKVNRRYITNGICLPSLISNELPKIVMVIDTSGSIDNQQLKTALSETKSILDNFNISELHVLYVDAEVGKHEIYTKFDDFNPQPKGGGGTDFRKAFEYIEENVEDVACLLYFTDLCGTFPDIPPDYSVVWMYLSECSDDYYYDNDDVEDFEVPFGTKVNVSMGN